MGMKRKKKTEGGAGETHATQQHEYNKLGEAADMKGKPGPNGEDPSTGRWSFEKRTRGGKNNKRGGAEKCCWRWRKFSEKFLAMCKENGEDPCQPRKTDKKQAPKAVAKQ